MRLRKVKGALDYLKEKEEFVITNLNDFAISNYFKDNKPIHLEIGCGKGQFIINMAKTYPDISFKALEKYDSVLLRAIKKYEDSEEKPTNLIFILGDFNDIYDYLPKNKINTIYLNFSDPWPKNRQAKRRLTHVNFLNKYRYEEIFTFSNFKCSFLFHSVCASGNHGGALPRPGFQGVCRADIR